MSKVKLLVLQSLTETSWVSSFCQTLLSYIQYNQ